MKNKFGFVLIKPQLGENIGASARSLKNFGFKNLSIVSPKQNWPNPKTKSTSVGAYDLIKKTKIYEKTLDALSEFDIVFALSARKRDINKKHISIDQFLKIISKKDKKKYGLMFGPEASGLTNEDISYSNYILQIPTSEKFKSRSKNIKLSSKKEVKHFMKHLVNLLEKKNFFTPQEKKHSMIMNINNLFYRFEPSDKELRVLASIISTLAKNNLKA